MQLFCKKCGKQILAEDMNLEMALAKCRGCSSVFSILDSLKEGDEPVPAGRRERLPVPMPKGFKVDEFGRELSITYRWFTPVVFVLLFFCVFWDGFLVVWYSIGIKELLGDTGWFALVMLLFPILHVAVGVALTYTVICMFINRTEIRVLAGDLSIWHGPIPFPGKCRIPTGEIKQLYVTENHHRRKNDCSTFTYTLNALKHDSTSQKLIGNLHDVQQALYLEQKLEEHLGIPAQHVPGEVAA